MKVTTSAPVYVNKKEVSNGDLYMNVGGDGKEKVKGALGKVGQVGKESGFFDYLLNKVGVKTTPPPTAPAPEVVVAPPTPFYKKPLFIGGAVLAVGVIVYFVVKSKKK